MLQQITEKIIQRSKASRESYLARVDVSSSRPPAQDRVSCSNWAHAVAAERSQDKISIAHGTGVNIGIVTAYNDMLSSHQPFATYPNLIKLHARSIGATAQVAGGVPAMCDGVTQGQPGMELSLFSRDIIALATAISLSHDVYDAAICLGVCDKIVPGLVIGALQFGHLPVMFVPSGPMPSGISNSEKAKARQQFVEGKISKAVLLESEMASYHSSGTCTFYGTANTNQTVMEALGLQLAGASFINPTAPLRPALTKESVTRVIDQSKKGANYRPISQVVTEKSMVNAMVVMMATDGSTNLTLHLIAMARAAGIQINWQDMDDISRITPLLAKIYPNGHADVNHFEQAGGLPFIMHERRSHGLLNEDVVNVMGEGLDAYQAKPELDSTGSLIWSAAINTSANFDIVSPVSSPFSNEGGIRILSGNIGKAVSKTSAVKEHYQSIEAPCKIFERQEELKQAFDSGALNCDHIAVVRFQGPAANGMPELHKLTPYLATIQDRGFKVALVTDGRMSGASGKVLSAIHVTPEAKNDGLLAYLRDGDILTVDAPNGVLAYAGDIDKIRQRPAASAPPASGILGTNLFETMRNTVGDSDEGASFL